MFRFGDIITINNLILDDEKPIIGVIVDYKDDDYLLYIKDEGLHYYNKDYLESICKDKSYQMRKALEKAPVDNHILLRNDDLNIKRINEIFKEVGL